MEYLCIIPARGGSSSIPNKNVQQLHGKPLIAWTIQHAVQTPKIGRIVVSTDSHRIGRVGLAFGAEVPFYRPSHLSGDSATTESAILHCIGWLEEHEDYKPDAVIVLACTTPVRQNGLLKQAIKQFEESNVDSLVSVGPAGYCLWEDDDNGCKPMYDVNSRPNKEALFDEDMRFEENESIYIMKTGTLVKHMNRVAGKVGLFKISKQESFNISSKLDFELGEVLMTHTQL